MEGLSALDPFLVASCVGGNDVDDSALCFTKPQLCVDFHYLGKASSHHRTRLIRIERQARAATGYTVPYQCMTYSNVSTAKWMAACAKLTVGSSRIEVPASCYAELLQVFSYKGRALMDLRSGYWVVALSIWLQERLRSFHSTRMVSIPFGGCDVE